MVKKNEFKTFHKEFGYFDRTGIQEYLEQKSSEGWALVNKQFASDWDFKRIVPQKLHYSITYLPQFTNEDQFLLSESKNEYLELCSKSGWQFVCAYKNMVIFVNENENPTPLQTDPEAELSLIHKSFLKLFLPKTLCLSAFLMILFFDEFFSETVSKTRDFTLLCCVLLSIYCIFDLLSYFRWRKKALTAAASGIFSKTWGMDKLLSVLFCIITILGIVAVAVNSYLTKNYKSIILIGTILTIIAIEIIIKKIENRIKSKWKKYLFKFASVLIYIALIAFIISS